MGILLLPLTAAFVAVGAIAAVHALATRAPARAAAVSVAAAVVLYAALLVGTSLASRETVLERGQRKAFCGFYLDCHLGVSVEGVETASALDGGIAVKRGRFIIVTLMVSSDALRARLKPYGLRAVLVDRGGRELPRDLAAEAALGETGSLEREIGPGESYTRRLVYNLPEEAARPALLATEVAWPDRLIEWVLIGDEDSLLHKKTLLALS